MVQTVKKERVKVKKAFIQLQNMTILQFMSSRCINTYITYNDSREYLQCNAEMLKA